MPIGPLIERFRSSLFFVPTGGVIVAVGLAQAGIAADKFLLSEGRQLPLALASTVDSARAVLSTIAAATITFAAVAFSISLLIIQLGSSQYSPRVVHTLARDTFNRRVMGLVVGTFAFCLFVLRSVRSPLEEGGEAVVPNLTVLAALALGILTILAVVAFIDHNARSMDISEILARVTNEAIQRARREWPEQPPIEQPGRRPGDLGATHTVHFSETGWIQQVDSAALLDSIPPGAQLRLVTHPGRYAVTGVPVCVVSPPPSDPEELERQVRAAVQLGKTRTMQQNVPYALRQLADVALKALSPGINDPTTAQDAIFHSAAVLGELLVRHPPASEIAGEGQRLLVFEQQYTTDELVGLTFDEVRRAASPHPSVCIYLLEAMSLVGEAVGAAGKSTGVEALRRQAALVVEGSRAASLQPEDRALVEKAFADRFSS